VSACRHLSLHSYSLSTYGQHAIPTDPPGLSPNIKCAVLPSLNTPQGREPSQPSGSRDHMVSGCHLVQRPPNRRSWATQSPRFRSDLSPTLQRTGRHDFRVRPPPLAILLRVLPHPPGASRDPASSGIPLCRCPATLPCTNHIRAYINCASLATRENHCVLSCDTRGILFYP
jgi:hypothetical protein